MYHYDSLPSSQFIRLVNINRDDASQNGFSVRLTTHSLNDLPPFWALSYTWDSPEFESEDEEDVSREGRRFNIKCNGHVMEVGESLYDFLRHMNEHMSATSDPSRPRTHPTSSAYSRIFLSPKRYFNFWIDAICIDQRNDNERSDQVQLMGDIYKSASRVIAWLGNTEPNDNVNWVINIFAPTILQVSEIATGNEFIRLCQDVGYELNHPRLEELIGARMCVQWRRSYWDFFAFFVKKRWLTRGWVVQEAAIPKPYAVILLCGKSQFSWTIINAFAALIFDMDWEDALFKNKLDHVYGTLGLMPLILGPKYPIGVTPSYDISVEQAFTDLATWLIPHLPNLDILGLASLTEKRSTALPSWVPDFSFHGPACYTSLQRVRQKRMKYAGWYGPLDATPKTSLFGSPKPFARINGSRLSLEGCRIDTIKQLHKVEHDDQGVLRNVSWILDFCNQDGTYLIGSDSLAEAVVHTLSADIRPRVILKKDYKERSEGWVKDCITYNWLISQDVEKPTVPTGIVDGSRRPFLTVDDALARGSQDSFRSGLVDNHITKVIDFVTPGRQVIITEGGFLGLGPAEVQVGDEIWLMRGGRMPLILRKPGGMGGVDEEYQLVGEAYIHGIMHGEMMNGRLRQSFHEVVIV